MLPDWVFRVGWGMPIARDYLQLRMTAAQLGCSKREARARRTQLDKAISTRVANTSNQLRWAIKTSVPKGEAGKSWGDLYFANELATALRELGQIVRVDTRDQVLSSNSHLDDVVLVLRGIEKVQPQPGVVNLLWVISHPARISNYELNQFDLVFAASNSWAKKKSKEIRKEIIPLLQATNPDKFHPDVQISESADDLLFVGNSRGVFRKIIADLLSVGLTPAIYGARWEEFVPHSIIKGKFIENSDLPSKYRSAGIVLNDHWHDMAKLGFYSNRLFDAAASGARVVSDEIASADDIFYGAVKVYRTPAELRQLCQVANHEAWGSPEEINARARRIGFENSFSKRAEKMLAEALAFRARAVKD